MSIESAGLAIIGDIHGQAEKLNKALDVLIPSGRRLVFVGDYIDRGPDSFEVMERLIRLSNTSGDSIVFLRGNHEAALIQWLCHDDMSPFIRHGGLATIKSYSADLLPGVVTDFPNRIPANHRNFLLQTRSYFETKDIFVSHAGFNPNNLDARDDESLIFGTNGIPFSYKHSATPRSLTVFGHFVQTNLRPRAEGDLVCLDTGCGTLPSGRLTVLLVPERQYLQF